MKLEYEVKYQVHALTKDDHHEIHVYDLGNLEGAQLKYYECLGTGNNKLVELQQVTVLTSNIQRYEDVQKTGGSV